MRRKFLAMGVLALSLSLTACGGSGDVSLSETDTEGTDGSGDVVHLATVPGLDLAALKLGEEKGFFEDQNLSLKTTIADSGGAVITGTVQGSYDIGYAAPTPILTAVSKGSELKLLGGSNSINYEDPVEAISLVTYPGSGIESISDLAGKTVAVNALKAASDFCLQAAAREAGVDTSTFDTIELPLNQMPTSVMEEQVDAAMLFEPFSTLALDKGVEVVTAPCQDGLPDESPYGFYISSSDKYEAETDLVDRFSEAARQSTTYANEHPDELREATVKYIDMDQELADKINLTSLQYDINRDSYEENVQLMVDLGFIESVESVQGFMP